jgi:hypothetical protein
VLQEKSYPHSSFGKEKAKGVLPTLGPQDVAEDPEDSEAQNSGDSAAEDMG